MIRTLGEEEMPDGELATRYRFTHALYQNVLYDDLVGKRRVLLHRQAGEQLQKHYGGQAPRIATQLALHFERGVISGARLNTSSTPATMRQSFTPTSRQRSITAMRSASQKNCRPKSKE